MMGGDKQDNSNMVFTQPSKGQSLLNMGSTDSMGSKTNLTPCSKGTMAICPIAHIHLCSQEGISKALRSSTKSGKQKVEFLEDIT